MHVKPHHLTADTAATSYDANKDLQPCGAPTKRRGGGNGKNNKQKTPPHSRHRGNMPMTIYNGVEPEGLYDLLHRQRSRQILMRTRAGLVSRLDMLERAIDS